MVVKLIKNSICKFAGRCRKSKLPGFYEYYNVGISVMTFNSKFFDYPFYFHFFFNIFSLQSHARLNFFHYYNINTFLSKWRYMIKIILFYYFNKIFNDFSKTIFIFWKLLLEMVISSFRNFHCSNTAFFKKHLQNL